MNFYDDPRPLIAELDSAWAHYTTDFDELMEQVLSSIVSWRWATDDMFPSHPLFGQADTTRDGESWRPFTRKWLPDDDPEVKEGSAHQHGFDKQGRIVLTRNRVWGEATVWREGGCDRLWIHESREEAGRFIWRFPSQDRVQFSRFWHNGDGQIESICCNLRERDTHFRDFEWFNFEGQRCVESIKQSFSISSEIPWAFQNYSEEELREVYRPVEGHELINNLVEWMSSRRQVEYSYSPSGELLKAEEFKANGEPTEHLLFHKLPERPLEETMEALAAKTAKTILKAAKKRSPAKPYRGLVLIYSAEHAHCGLPCDVSVLGHETPWPEDRFYYENYPMGLEVVFKRPILSLLSEFNQRCYARFTRNDLDGDTEAAVTVMRTIAEQLHQALAETKHVTGDFAVLAIDDHGDVEVLAVPA